MYLLLAFIGTPTGDIRYAFGAFTDESVCQMQNIMRKAELEKMRKNESITETVIAECTEFQVTLPKPEVKIGR